MTQVDWLKKAIASKNQSIFIQIHVEWNLSMVPQNYKNISY